MAKAKFIDIMFMILHSAALGLNILTLYLFSRIGLKEIDMWLGTIMASCDLVLSVFKLVQIPVVLLAERESTLFYMIVNIPLSCLIIFVVRFSTVSVGYLAIIRWLVICRKYRPSELRWIMRVYIGHMITFIFALLFCYCFDGFKLTPNGRFYHPDWRVTNPWGFLSSVIMNLNLIFCTVAFNGSYILIARQYLRQLAASNSPSHLYHHKPPSRREKYSIIIKIALMLILYNFTVLPPLIVSMNEMITATTRTLTAGLIAYSSIICIALVNPMVLITMHCETWQTFRNLFSPRQTHPRYPRLAETDSDLILDSIDPHHMQPLPSPSLIEARPI